jgi:2'-5' RNA ligase
MARPADPTARVFFALVPPPPLRAVLGALATGVAQRAHGRAVPADNLHVTVAFVGAWPLSRLAQWIDAGARCAARPIHVTLDTLGGFRRAGVAWLGASAPPEPLLDLGRSLNAELVAAGIASARPFHPHVTLARKCRGPFPRDSAGPYRLDIDALSLMQSQPDGTGVRYDVLRQWRLLH